VKWLDSAAELKHLAESDPKHRLLVGWRLGQISSHLTALGSKEEAKAVRDMKRRLYPPKKK
jgi:hypothetical protein